MREREGEGERENERGREREGRAGTTARNDPNYRLYGKIFPITRE